MTLLASDVVEAQTSVYRVILLHPNGFTHSEAHRISDEQVVVGVGWNHSNLDDQQALLWSGAGTQVRSLNPGANFSSIAWGVSGSRIAGSVAPMGMPGLSQATLWLSYGDSRVSLTPSGFSATWANDVSDTQVVGAGGGPATSSAAHTLLWTNANPASAVDLNPSLLGFVFSEALGVHAASGQQVGSGNRLIGVEGNHILFGPNRALLWRGSADSAIVLHPTGFASSTAVGVHDSFQLGVGVPTGSAGSRALLWQGSAANVVNLHPPGFTETFALKTRGNRQVGYGTGASTQNRRHALLWHGTAASVVDLHDFLSDEYAESAARHVDQYGNIVGAAIMQRGKIRAILWQRMADLQALSFPDGSRTQGNRFARVRIKLDGPAAGDAIVALSSSNPAVVVPPRSQNTVVPSGSDFGIDGVWVNTVAVQTRVTITATYRGTSRSAVLTVLPARLVALKFNPARVPPCQSTSGIIMLDGLAPAGGATVALSGSSSLAAWPARVTVPASSDRMTFTITTGKSTGPVTMSADYNRDTIENSFWTQGSCKR